MKTQTKISSTIKSLLGRLNRNFGKWQCKEIDFNCAACQAELLRSGLHWWYDLENWDAKKASPGLHKLKL